VVGFRLGPSVSRKGAWGGGGRQISKRGGGNEGGGRAMEPKRQQKKEEKSPLRKKRNLMISRAKKALKGIIGQPRPQERGNQKSRRRAVATQPIKKIRRRKVRSLRRCKGIISPRTETTTLTTEKIRKTEKKKTD